MPIANLKVDFHFVRSNGHQFQCSDPSGAYYAPTYVAQMLARSNDLFSNPAPNSQSPAPVVSLTDTRFRVSLAGDQSAPCGGIFLHEQEPTTFSNPDAMHIIVMDDANAAQGNIPVIGGQLLGNDKMMLANIHYAVFSWGSQDVSVWGGSINHEFGHRFGLAHTFCSGNTCPDIDPVAECGGPTPGQEFCDRDKVIPCPSPIPSGIAFPNDCGTNTCFACYCTWGLGNNFMGYNANMRGITPYQWGQMYESMLNERPSFLEFEAAFCSDQPPAPPLSIPANTVAVWDYFKMVNQNVEVQTGATLIVRCEVQMGKNLSINVNRGARLFVLGGKITSQSPDCLWRGIFVQGNAAMDQPATATAQDEGQPLPVNGAGVVWLNGATISNASTAISTSSAENYYDQSRYGGLVMVFSSEFINNKRAVEFLRYGKKNKSYFTLAKVLKSGTPPWPVDKGVSIWACQGIQFTDTHFDKIGEYGILGHDFSMTAENCSFKNGNSTSYGIRIESTMPNAAEGSITVKGCQFERLRYGIYSNSTPNMVYPLEVSNGCHFFLGKGPASMGIRIAGESKFSVKNNIFDGHIFSSWASATGISSSEFRCNFYESFTGTGIRAVSENSGLKVLGNQFLNSGGIEVHVAGTPGQLGRINAFQGNVQRAAGNCFLNPDNAIVMSANSTEKLRYYVYDLSSNPAFCEKPTNNLSDGGVNNYETKESQSQGNWCDGGFSYLPVTEGDLATARQNTAAARAAWLASPNSLPLEMAYHQATEWQEYVLNSLAQAAYSVGDLDKVEALLLGENTNDAKRWVTGLRLKRGNVAGAQALLNSIVNEGMEDAQFKQIMAVNIALAQSPSPLEFQLSQQQEAMLHAIADMPHSKMQGYACALLSFCKGYVCSDDSLIAAIDGPLEERPKAERSTAAAENFRIYPNPSDGVWAIECPAALRGELLLEVFDFSGKLALSQRFVNSGTHRVNKGALAAGLYFVRVSRNRELLYSAKLAVTD